MAMEQKPPGSPGPAPVNLGGDTRMSSMMAMDVAGNASQFYGTDRNDLLAMPDVDMDECFAIDVSCTGSRTTGPGNSPVQPNGYSLEGGRRFLKIGSQRPALLVSTKGYTSGARFWELLDLVTPPTAKISFGIGVVPRSAEVGLDINGDIQQNGGHGAVLTHGGVPGGVRHGDRIGVLLDLTGETGRLSFFLNGQFAGIPSLTGLPKDRPMLPSFCATGCIGAECRFEVLHPPALPDIAAHYEMEKQHLNRKQPPQDTPVEKPPGGMGALTSSMTPEEEARAVEVAMAHTGGTIEFSSQLQEEIALRQGDAVLFVDVGLPRSGAEWFFRIDDERVLARDRFYHHTEFDPHMHDATGNSGCVGLKVAHKFVALQKGQTTFSSRYANPSANARNEEWHQTLRITVTERRDDPG